MNDVEPNDEKSGAFPAAKNNKPKNTSPPPEDTPKHIREVSDVQTNDEESDALPVAKNNEPKNSSTPPDDTPKHMREMNDVQTNDEESGSLPAAKNNKRKNSSPPPEDTPKHIRYSDPDDSTSTSPPAIIPFIDRSSVDKVEDRPDDLFTCLPIEIILHVLNYLSLRDRRSVRLTCRILNECSKRVSFTRKEKFVFPVGRYRLSTSLISKILSRTNSSVLNIEFRGDNAIMYSLSADVWKTCGDRVLSLSFHNCLPEIPVLQDILACCGNLEIIEFGEYFPAKKKLLLGYEFERVLNHSIQRKVECTQLHTVIMFHIEEIHASLLKKIFIVFPNVKYLHGRFHDPNLTAEHLKPFVQLRSLTYLNSQRNYHGMAPEPISWLKFGTTPELQIRLTEFRTHLERAYLDSNSADSSLFRFVTSQDQLEIFSLSMSEPEPADSDDVKWKKQLMFHVLRCCPKLREFCFSLSQFTLLNTTDEIADFLDLISKLRCLKLSYLPQTPIGVPQPHVHTKLALDTFQVTVTYGSSELLLHVSKHCPRMQHLFITEEPHIDILIEIFRSMPELRTLSIRAVLRHLRGRHVSAKAFYDMRGLQNLEYLEVHAQRFEELPVKELQKNQFRRMKHVKLVVSPVSNLTRIEIADELREILWNMPAVETVELPGLEQHFGRKLVKTFRKLKNLRSLVLHGVDEENLELLFKGHPTLKFVSDLSVCYRRTYAFDQSAVRLIFHPLYSVEEQGALGRPFQDL